MKHVVMMSSGAGSAAAGKRVAERYGAENTVLLFADVNGEHEDNYRFLREATEWIGADLVTLDNDGKTIWDTFREQRYLGNTRIDPCSKFMKRQPMRRWLEENCEVEETVVHIGFDWTEGDRITRMGDYWLPWKTECPLTWEPVMDKQEVIDWLSESGIEPPWLTRQGFPHANCGGGCVKAGQKQFKKLLEVNPTEFAKWETEELKFREWIEKDVSILRDRRGGDTKPMTLKEFRERLGVEPYAFDDGDWGACNCMTPPREQLSLW